MYVNYLHTKGFFSRSNIKGVMGTRRERYDVIGKSPLYTLYSIHTCGQWRHTESINNHQFLIFNSHQFFFGDYFSTRKPGVGLYVLQLLNYSAQDIQNWQKASPVRCLDGQSNQMDGIILWKNRPKKSRSPQENL